MNLRCVTKSYRVRLQLHCAICRPDSFVLMLRYCVNLKAIRYESTSFNRIVADKSHRVIAALNLQQSHEIHCNLWVNQNWKTKGRICSFQK